MALQELDRIGNGIEDVSGCDESKCVSKGKSQLFEDSFTCYGDKDDNFYPMMCADGFLPVVVEDESPVVSKDEDTSLSYFTCCPPNKLLPEVIRHCSDPITPPIDSNDDVCQDQDIHKYARQMESSGTNPEAVDAFICCDSFPTLSFIDDDDNNTTTAIDFLDDLECVPYQNEFYEPAMVQNKIGELDVIICDLPDGDFNFSRAIGQEDVALTGRYQCCKTGPDLPPFAHDSIFKVNVYPTTILFAVAIILSVIVVVGLLTLCSAKCDS